MLKQNYYVDKTSIEVYLLLGGLIKNYITSIITFKISYEIMFPLKTWTIIMIYICFDTYHIQLGSYQASIINYVDSHQSSLFNFAKPCDLIF